LEKNTEKTYIEGEFNKHRVTTPSGVETPFLELSIKKGELHGIFLQKREGGWESRKGEEIIEGKSSLQYYSFRRRRSMGGRRSARRIGTRIFGHV